MVVKPPPDSISDLLSKAKVKIPCQCYYDARDNVLTEIIHHSCNQFPNPEITSFETKNLKKCSSEKIKHPQNVPEKKDAETETQPEHCCVCEYFRNLESSKHKKDLWNMQFNRWWGWNWQRKRKDLFSKFKIKCDKTCDCHSNSKHETTNLNNGICNCNSLCQNPSPKISSFARPRQQIEDNMLSIPELAEPLEPIPPVTTYTPKKPYYTRRKRNKYKQRSYEGWVREVTSSESENSVESVKITMEAPKTPNNKEHMRCLSLRMRKLNSDESLDNDKITNEQDRKIILPADSKYVSPFSGKYYNLNLPEISLQVTGTNDTEYLKPLDIKDERIIPKPEFDWMKHYNLMKQEHSELLKSICDVMYGTLKKDPPAQSEKEIKNIDYTHFTSEINNILSNKNCVEVQTNVSINKLEEMQQKNLFLNLGTSEIKCNKNNVEVQTNNLEEMQQKNLFLNFETEIQCNKNSVEVQTNNLEEMQQKNLFLNLETSEIKCNKNSIEVQKNNLEEMQQKTSSLSLTSEIKSYLSSEKYLNPPENVSTNQIEENPFQNLDLQNTNLHFDHKSESDVILKNSPFYDCTVIKSLIDTNTPLPNYKYPQHLLISKSSNLFYKDAVEHVEDETEEKDLNYDINYITNNLQSFASSISDTEFLNCQTDDSRINVKEEISEKLIGEVDLRTN